MPGYKADYPLLYARKIIIGLRVRRSRRRSGARGVWSLRRRGRSCSASPQPASGTPIECPPPSTRDTVGFFIPDIISAMASPASTSPPMVFRSISSASISGVSSIAAMSGSTCSYFVVFTSSGCNWCPSICPTMVRHCMAAAAARAHFFYFIHKNAPQG